MYSPGRTQTWPASVPYASHKLNVIPSARPIRQKVRLFYPDRHQVIQVEVDNLLKEKFISEIKYPKWLANVVVVPKKCGKWRVCMDYTDLNEACSKDNFPLPRIDQIVDASAEHGMLSFLDAFSGYHQILMLQCDPIWLKECWGNVSEVSDQDVQSATWRNHGVLH